MSTQHSQLAEVAKRTLANFVPIIDPKIEQYFDLELKRDFGFSSRQKKVIRQAIEHSREIVLRPQKHLRGSFVIYGYKLGQKEISDAAWKAACAVEIVHGALLIHDDFMDQDDIRRGGETTHVYYKRVFGGDVHAGESMAVTVGDAVLCVGFELMAECENPKAMKQMLRAIANTVYGQAYDVTLEQIMNWTEEDVLILHHTKTGLYTYENPLLVGAYLAGVDGTAIQVLKDYSADGGVAFQLQDDILGVFGDPEKTGKSADSDLKQGKCTLLVLKALQEGTPEQVKQIRKAWGNRKATKEQLAAAKEAIKESGSYEYNKELASKIAGKAAKTAEKLRGLNLNPEAIDYIQGVAEYMVTREV